MPLHLSLCGAPDNLAMAAVTLALAGGGALSRTETTVLLTVDETLEAVRRVEQVGIARRGPSVGRTGALLTS